MARFLRGLARLVVCCLAIAGSSTAAQEFRGAGAFEPPPVYFGIQVKEADSPMARRLRIGVDRGVLVAGVRPDSPCAQAGLKPGDVVFCFGGVETPTIAALTAAMRQATIGANYRTEFSRGGQQFFADVVAGRQPPPPAEGYPQIFNLGLFAVSAGSEAAHRMGIESPQGTVVTEVRPGSAAAQAGIRRGDLIVEFAGHQTETFEDYQAVAFRCPPGSRQTMTLVRGHQRLTTAITIATRPRAELPWYYGHAQGDYRFALLPEWQSFGVEQPGVPLQRQYDRVISIFAGYELRCYKGSFPASAPEAALQQFLDQQLGGDRRRQSGRTTLGGAPAAWVTMRPSGEPYLLYRIALIYQGRGYLIDALAPVLSDPRRLPLPVLRHLETIQFRPRDGSISEGAVSPMPAAAATKPSPPPGAAPQLPHATSTGEPTAEAPPGWITHSLGNVTISVPPDWTASEFAAADEGLWFKGGDPLLPEVYFSLVRDTPPEELTRGGTATRKRQTALGRWQAEEFLVNVAVSDRPATGLVVVLSRKVAGGTIAFVGYAPPAQWKEHEKTFRKILAFVRIEPAKPAGTLAPAQPLEGDTP